MHVCALCARAVCVRCVWPLCVCLCVLFAVAYCFVLAYSSIRLFAYVEPWQHTFHSHRNDFRIGLLCRPLAKTFDFGGLSMAFDGRHRINLKPLNAVPANMSQRKGKGSTFSTGTQPDANVLALTRFSDVGLPDVVSLGYFRTY